MSKYSKNNPFNQIYSGLLAMALIILVTITISLLATASKQAMRRESGRSIPVAAEVVSLEISPEFEEALYQSMRRGYLQSVNWDWAEVA